MNWYAEAIRIISQGKFTETEIRLAQRHPKIFVSCCRGENLYNVILMDPGERKISVIKEIRNIVRLGLKEAKELIDTAPQVVISGINSENAIKFKAQLEGAGATVLIKQED